MRRIALLLVVLLFSTPAAHGEEPASASTEGAVKRVLLLGQSPDNHPFSTHEYVPGLRVVETLLADVPGLELTMVNADEPWSEGPELLEKADGVVMFLSAGGRWSQADPRRYEALVRLAQRGGGIAALHWGAGTKKDEDVPGFLQLVGACHGGHDRKFKVLDTQFSFPNAEHPVCRGLEPIAIRDEFYYALKRVQPAEGLTSLVQVDIDGSSEMVAWGWQRPDGGRSFGFTGLHFHENWQQETYRRLAAQGVLWAMGLPIPVEGLDVDLPATAIELAPRLSGQ